MPPGGGGREDFQYDRVFLCLAPGFLLPNRNLSFARVSIYRTMRTLLADLRYGFRLLRQSPGFTTIAILALALGIGANTAIFSTLDAVLLRPLPYADPDRVVMVWEDASSIGFAHNTPAPANYFDWREQNHVFTGYPTSDAGALAVRSRAMVLAEQLLELSRRPRISFRSLESHR